MKEVAAGVALPEKLPAAVREKLRVTVPELERDTVRDLLRVCVKVLEVEDEGVGQGLGEGQFETLGAKPVALRHRVGLFVRVE